MDAENCLKNTRKSTLLETFAIFCIENFPVLILVGIILIVALRLILKRVSKTDGDY